MTRMSLSGGSKAALQAGSEGIDLEHVQRVAERLRGEFGLILRGLPPHARTIAGMAAELDIPRPGCQRLLRALRARGPLAESLTFFPGLRGLQQIVEAARAKGFDATSIAGAEAALRQFADLMADYGGSQSQLNEAIAEAMQVPSLAPLPNESNELDRRRAFESWRQITRRSFETQFAVYIYRPIDGQADRIHTVTAMGMIGIESERNALPLCIVSASVPRDDKSSLAAESLPGLSGLPISLVPGFSSSPAPQLTVRRQPGRVAILTECEPGTSSDVVLARQFREVRHPAADEPRQQYCWLISEGPSRNLLMYVFMHRTMARLSIPSADAYYIGSRGVVGAQYEDDQGETHVELPAFRWFDRLPDGPRLEQLGAGLQHAGHTCYPRGGDLTKELFRRQNWDPEEFIGVRFHVSYPVWGAQYLITLDFNCDD